MKIFKNSMRKGSSTIILVFLLVAVAVGLTIFIINIAQTPKVKVVTPNGPAPSVTRNINIPYRGEVPTFVAPTIAHPARKILKRDGQPIASFISDYGTTLLKWHKFVFIAGYDENKTSDGNLRILRHDMDSGLTVNVFDRDASGIFSDSRIPNQISGLRVVRDKLYFTLDGYLTQGGFFSINLTDATPAASLIFKEPVRLTNIDNHELLVNGFGDGCGGSATYWTIDLATNSRTKIIDSHLGCNTGEEFLGVDQKDRVVIGIHEVSKNDSGENVFPDQIYRSLWVMPLSDLASKSAVLAPDLMPEGITSAQFFSDLDEVFLEGNRAKFRFNIADLSLVKVDSLPEIPPNTNSGGKPVEEQFKALGLPGNYSLDIE